jgi:hypothetical protein
MNTNAVRIKSIINNGFGEELIKDMMGAYANFRFNRHEIILEVRYRRFGLF